MTVHELIEKLQKIPNQNMEVHVTSDLTTDTIEILRTASKMYGLESNVIIVDGGRGDEQITKREG